MNRFSLVGTVSMKRRIDDVTGEVIGIGTSFVKEMVGKHISLNNSKDILRIESVLCATQMKVVGRVFESCGDNEAFLDVFIDNVKPTKVENEVVKSLLETSLTKEQIIRVLDVI